MIFNNNIDVGEESWRTILDDGDRLIALKKSPTSVTNINVPIGKGILKVLNGVTNGVIAVSLNPKFQP